MNTCELNTYVLESAKGWKVVMSDKPFGQLYPGNFTVIADGFTSREKAAEFRKRLVNESESKLR